MEVVFSQHTRRYAQNRQTAHKLFLLSGLGFGTQNGLNARFDASQKRSPNGFAQHVFLVDPVMRGSADLADDRKYFLPAAAKDDTGRKLRFFAPTNLQKDFAQMISLDAVYMPCIIVDQHISADLGADGGLCCSL
jgi:hypothetical protein